MHLLVGIEHDAHRDRLTIQYGIEHLVVILQVPTDTLIERILKEIVFLRMVFLHRGIIDTFEVPQQFHAFAMPDLNTIFLSLANHIAVLANDVLPNHLGRN